MDGIIIINKPRGCTSHDIVYKAKKITGEKVGHTGTLDPNATGVLPLLIGKGTLLSKYLINHDKIYEVTLKLGEKRDTADGEGEVIETNTVQKEVLTEENVIKVLNSFIGKQEQIPPMYSAIKVKGKKLYEYARKGESIELTPRKIEIYDIQLLNINKEELEICFEVSCSKGTYIRSLCEDIASKLKTVGYMKELKRTKVGDFDIKQAITIDEFESYTKQLKQDRSKEDMKDYFISIEKAFENKQAIKLNNLKLKKFLNGVKLETNMNDDTYKIYNEDNCFIGIGIVKSNFLKRDIIL